MTHPGICLEGLRKTVKSLSPNSGVPDEIRTKRCARVRPEFIMVVTMKINVSWGLTPYSLVDRYRYFGGFSETLVMMNQTAQPDVP
jgi:hypothetical protein